MAVLQSLDLLDEKGNYRSSDDTRVAGTTLGAVRGGGGERRESWGS